MGRGRGRKIRRKRIRKKGKRRKEEEKEGKKKEEKKSLWEGRNFTYICKPQHTGGSKFRINGSNRETSSGIKVLSRTFHGRWSLHDKFKYSQDHTGRTSMR
jgi:hypothetical protein